MRIYMIGQKGIPAHGGGVERHVEELATRLAKRGHEVFVYCRAHYTPRTSSVYRGVHLIHLPTIPTKHLDAIVHTLLASIHVLFQPADVIHYHSIGPASLMWLPRLLKRSAKIVFTFHSQCYYHGKWGMFARLYLRLGETIGCRGAHRVITVSKILTKYVWSAYQRETTYVPNGVGDVVQEKSDRSFLKTLGLEHRGYILTVARLLRIKGIHELIRAYNRVFTKKKLVIVGEDAGDKRYMKELARLAQENLNVLFVGGRSGKELTTLYRYAYLFVQPSRVEGLSIVLLEAMAHGLGILASDIPENREVIRGIGHTFKTGSVMDCARKLHALLASPALVRRSGMRARERVRREYHWDDIVRTTERLYEKSVATPRSSLAGQQLFSISQ